MYTILSILELFYKNWFPIKIAHGKEILEMTARNGES
jgi:hypothetical protein